MRYAGLMVLPLLLAAAACTETSSAGPATDRHFDQPSPDAWEASPEQKRALKSCVELDSFLIVPVPEGNRPDAIARLENAGAIALDTKSASTVLDVEPERATAQGHIKDLLARYRTWKQRGSNSEFQNWSRYDQDRLDRLEKLDTNPLVPRLTPFLVRAVVKNYSLAGLGASFCGDTLAVSHFSLGHETPPSIRFPFVIFLDHAPTTVVVGWGTAE